ncbi:MAG: hypothetical protein KZQ95_10730 [Candidatus Thiodiazotropha sp. (ex Epidulcina cf. delphinae)]|nr:hypothetical protein [Candidatus Thiodiazotropha sp. (ex Epidulcina cf. delphinae)]
MLWCRNIFTSLICFSMLLASLCAYAEEEIEDLVDIYESNAKIIAVLEGRKSVSFKLLPKETVLWRDAKGYLGAFLTNRRFFVISTSSGAWQVLPLRSGDSDNRVAVLSPYIALLAIAGDRAFGFDARSNRFIETRLPLYDELLAAKAEKNVAVVVTSSKAFGLAAGNSRFTEIRLRVRETVESIKTTSSKATIRTPNRLLTFEAAGSRWNEHRL